MKLDYKDSLATSPKKAPRKKSSRWFYNWRLHTMVVAAAGVSSLFFLTESEDTQASIEPLHEIVEQPLHTSVELSLPAGPSSAIIRETAAPAAIAPVASQEIMQSAALVADTAEKVIKPEVLWDSVTIKSGDSLARIANREGIGAAEIHRLMQSGDAVDALKRIRPGQEIRYRKDAEGQLLALEYDSSDTERLIVTRLDDGFAADIAQRPYQIQQNRITGKIENSLYGSAKKAGMSDNLIMELANVFGYDIDFALDIRSGDTFTVIWEELYRDGEKVKDGSIVAAEFVNAGRQVRAVRYTDATGDTDYYTPDGKSLRKAFLRSPVHFTRISSKFNPNRLHPVFKTKRPHRGVDYAAKTGTPIYAAGDGKVIFRGKKTGYGNVVILKHGQKYSTLYAHMSRFNKKARNGSRVKQGQVIGYVGATGWATGPHLHYEFRVNGTHRNPLTVKLPAAQPLPKKYRQDFQQFSAPLLAQLDTLNRTQLALQEQ